MCFIILLPKFEQEILLGGNLRILKGRMAILSVP